MQWTMVMIHGAAPPCMIKYIEVYHLYFSRRVGVDMRLRFRGPCWDDSEQRDAALPTHIGVPSSARQQSNSPLRSLRRFLRSEGFEALSPYDLPRRPPAGTDLSKSCSWAVTLQKGRTANELRQTGIEEEAEPAGRHLRQLVRVQVDYVQIHDDEGDR